MKHTKKLLALLLCALLAFGISAPVTASATYISAISPVAVDAVENQSAIVRLFNAIARTIIILIMIFVFAVGLVWVYTNVRDIIRANRPAPSPHTPTTPDQPADQPDLDYYSYV